MTSPPRISTLRLPMLVTGGLGIVAGATCLALAPDWHTRDAQPRDADTGAREAGIVATGSPSPAVPVLADRLGVPPGRLRVPARGVEGPVVPVGVLPGGDLQLPDDPDVTGWWAGGRGLGSPAGSIVIAGHVDSATSGLGLLAVLHQVQAGDLVTVRDVGGRPHHFRVTARRSYPKSRLPPDLFTSSGPPRLVLVTCGGAFDQRSRRYEDNVVVVARPE
jgi:hypothetical protein